MVDGFQYGTVAARAGQFLARLFGWDGAAFAFIRWNRIAYERLGNPTVTAYDALAISVRRPNGVTAVTERYLDGQAKRVLENGVVKQSYAHGVNPDGTRWTLSANGPLPAIDPITDVADLRPLISGLDFPWSLSVAGPLNHPVAQHKPGFGRTVLVTSNAYDNAGNLLSSTQASCLSDGSRFTVYNSELYSYSADGSLFFTALDINANGVIDLDGPDRVTGTSSAYEKDASNLWWRVSCQWVYPEFNSFATVTTSVQRAQLTGLGVQQGNDGVLTAQTETFNVRGNVTTTGVLIDRDARRMMKATVSPTSIQSAVQTTVNGLLVRTLSSTAVSNTYAYDALGRQTIVTEGRGNTTVTAYSPVGQILFSEDAANNRTTYGYDFFGRRTSVTDALGNVTRTQYDAKGRVSKTWDATYPVEYGYDAQGRMVSMKTFRDENGSGDETRWLYDGPTGLLTNKLYADGRGPVYTYTPDHKLATRLWVRGISTAYTYDSTGALLSVDHSDDTPDVAYTYDRLGIMASVTDASGLRTFSHSPGGFTLTEAIQFQHETFTLHEAYDAFGHSAGYTLSNSVGGVSSLIAGTAQGYDAFGRISEVSVDGIALPFQYGYMTGTDLQNALVMPNGVTRQTTYDPHRDLLASVTHTNAAGTVLARRTYAYDAAGRLTGRTQYRLGDETNRFDAFGYNARSELTSAAVGTNAYAYAFDPIGNRKSTTEDTFTWDPTEPVATRPLALQAPSGWFAYAFDQVKNVTELFDASGAPAATYDFAPFGAVIAATGIAVSINPLTFSSEIADAALGLQYYNFRHLNTLDGRWMNRDPIEEIVEVNIYRLVNNQPSLQVDHLGLVSFWEWLLEVLGKKKKDEEKKCCTMDPLLASAISALVNDIADAVKNVPNGPSTVAPWIRAANAIKDLACLDASSIEDNCEEFKNDPNFTTCFSCCYVIYQTAGSVEVNAMGWRICEGACSIMFPVGIFE